MYKVLFFVIVFIACAVNANSIDGVIDDDVQHLLDSLTLKQQIGQMTQLAVSAVINTSTMTVKEDVLKDYIENYNIGSIFDTPLSGHDFGVESAWGIDDWRPFIKLIQDLVQESDSPKIPLLYGLDSVHGANYVKGATIFPHQLAAAASFRPDLVEAMAAVEAKDTRAAGIPWAFSPILGIMMQSNWPRVYETFGEDPYLVGELGAAMIKGLQGWPTDLSNPVKVAASMKHFVGYPMPESGQDRSPSWIPDRFLYEYFLPPFRKAIEAGVATTMEAYCEINGIPIASSHFYLTQLLREELQFNGTLVTDYAEINNLHNWHRIAPSIKDAVYIAMRETTIDMSMVPLDVTFAEDLYELIQEGMIDSDRVYESAGRILQLKKDLGLFDNPLGFDEGVDYDVGGDEDHQLALDIAREAVTLVKNDGILPLDLGQGQKILLTGPSSNSLHYQSGGWSIHWQGADNDEDFTHGYTVLDYLNILVENTPSEVTQMDGCEFDANCTEDIYQPVLDAAEDADIIVLCTGEKAYTEKVGNINEASIDNGQYEFAKLLAATGKKVILVLFEGRPRLLHEMADDASAILVAFLPGPEGGRAVAEILSGDVNPSGKLPISYPQYTNNFWAPYWHKWSRDDTFFPEWSFGYGLSYTTFNYSSLELSASTVNPEDTLEVSVTVTNTGNVDGKETVLLYIVDNYRIITPEVKRLRRFEKVDLEAGESHRVTFELPIDELSFYGRNNERRLENGDFTVIVGDLKTGFSLEGAPDYIAHDHDADFAESGLLVSVTSSVAATVLAFSVGMATAFAMKV